MIHALSPNVITTFHMECVISVKTNPYSLSNDVRIERQRG